ncbi:acetyltransferase [Hydrogenivirga sp. 128-5-R1-1]|uniref:acetyltransferase n=1 Tax=Hydrogenivirga sp. 128-5-R1-1 TaxID=392423 RepID=UPI00015F2BBE|nr:acetyltransferase [Hydrogenivirga sp. 128-5-R1-1]EDP73500.1 acetyl transferase [Hydrogenivirga sp. 128-5-R1-1]
MSKKPEILLIGGGGHCKSVIDVIEQENKFKIAGIVDTKEKIGEKVLGYKIIASDEDLEILSKEYKYAFISLGQIDNCEKRKELFKKCKNLGFNLPKVISLYAYVSKYSIIGEGTIVMHGAIINAGAKIGNNCIINSKALIEHDAEIEDNCHISTGAIINGGVKVKECSFIGSNATTKQYITIPKNSFIKAGSIVK